MQPANQSLVSTPTAPATVIPTVMIAFAVSGLTTAPAAVAKPIKPTHVLRSVRRSAMNERMFLNMEITLLLKGYLLTKKATSVARGSFFRLML
jgi:hypothetical protein